MTYSTMDEAREAIAAAESDTIGDQGEEAWEAGAHDVIVGIALHSCTPAIGDEILRTELGITRAEADPWS